MDSSTQGFSLSPQDRDFTIRTMLGEAANQGDDGMAGVANVVLNRVASGRFGRTAADVVTAPAQFTPWQTRRNELLSYSPDSPAYQRAGQILDDAASGQAPDVTGGATHFYAPALVAKPKWSRNETTQIGGHIYSAPDGPVERNTAMASSASPDDVFSELMAHAQSSAGGPTGAGATPAPSQSVDDVFGELAARAQQNAQPATATPAAAPASQTVAPATASPPQSTGDASAAVGAGILNGVPIAGPYLLSGAEHAAALARVASFGGTYEDALKHVRDFTQGTTDAHPYATTAGNLIGATAATVPLVAAAPAAFGIGGSSGLGAVAAGAGSGAAIGGADAAVRSGGDPSQVIKGTVIGAVAGGAGPAVGRVVGLGANKLLNAANDIGASSRDGISASTRNLLLDSINRDGPQFIQSELQRLGPNGMLADIGSAVQGRAQGVAIREGGADLVQAIKDRTAGTNARIRDAVTNLGPAEDPQNVTDNILALRGQIDNRNYGQALGNAPPVHVGHVVDLIDDHLETAVGMQRRALEGIRSEVVQRGANGQPIAVDDARVLHNLKGEIDNVIQHDAPGLGVPAGAVNRAQGSLQLIRGALNDALQDQVPGYEAANNASSALARRAEAVQAGVNTLSSGKTAPTPQRFIDQFNALQPGEQVAQAKGLLAEVNRRVGVNANDLGAMRTALQGEEGWNTAKMARVLGDEPVNRLMSAVGQEGQFGQTYNKVVGNAQTAFRSRSSSELDRASPFGVDVDVSKVSTPGAILGTLKGAVYNPLLKYLATTDTVARDSELARILSATGPKRDAFVNKLLEVAGRTGAIPRWSDAIGNAGNALMNAVQEPYRLAR